MLASDQSVRLTEIFYSLQGESSWAGEPTVFVRLTGCPLRCVWCDTAYAFQGGELFTIPEVLDKVAEFGVGHVCVTGGEPLAQPICLVLLEALADAGYQVSLETSGALDIEPVDGRIKRIVDLKAPTSGEQQRNRLENLPLLTANDEVKFVVGNREDFEWAESMVSKHGIAERAGHVLLSPVHGELDLQQLAGWVLASRNPLRLQMQLHKLIWGEKPGV